MLGGGKHCRIWLGRAAVGGGGGAGGSGGKGGGGGGGGGGAVPAYRSVVQCRIAPYSNAQEYRFVGVRIEAKKTNKFICLKQILLFLIQNILLI